MLSLLELKNVIFTVTSLFLKVSTSNFLFVPYRHITIFYLVTKEVEVIIKQYFICL